MSEKAEELPESLTNDDSVEIPAPGDFIKEGDQECLRSRYFKTSQNPVESIFLVKMPLHQNRENGEWQRYIQLVATQKNQEYKTKINIGRLMINGLKFSKNCLSHCGPGGCEVASFDDDEKAIIVGVLGASVVD